MKINFCLIGRVHPPQKGEFATKIEPVFFEKQGLYELIPELIRFGVHRGLNFFLPGTA